MIDIYCDELSETEVVQNITKICTEIIYIAENCYEKHKEEIERLSQIPIQDFDADLESMRECAILSERINNAIKSRKKD